MGVGVCGCREGRRGRDGERGRERETWGKGERAREGGGGEEERRNFPHVLSCLTENTDKLQIFLRQELRLLEISQKRHRALL